MPFKGRYTATATKDTGAAVTALEAKTNIDDVKISGAAGSDVESEISSNIVHFVVRTGADVDSTTTVSLVADAIDKAVMGSATVDGAIAATDSTSFALHSGESAVGALYKKAIAIDGFVYAIIDTEIVKITAIAADNITCTVVRGALASTAATHIDDVAMYWYCGPDNTVVGVDDESVWGTIASHTSAGGTLTVICGTEQMRVTALAPSDIPDTFLCTRGANGTTAAAHADNAAVTQRVDSGTAIFDVASGAALVEDAQYKPGATGQEAFTVDTISTNRITVTRGVGGSTPVANIADATALFRMYGDDLTLSVDVADVGGFAKKMPAEATNPVAVLPSA